MNSNAVFWNPNYGVAGTATVRRLWNCPATGTYTFRYQCDDVLNMYVDNGLRISHSGFSGVPPTSAQSVTAGIRELRFDITNGGGPGGCAFTISSGATAIWGLRSRNESETRRGGWAVQIERVSNGSIVWTTRGALEAEVKS
jgi:hypothetical protein